jgi:hypothetical protein
VLRCDWGKVILADPCHRRRFGPVDNHCPPPASATGLPMEESELEAAHRHVTQSRRIVATQHERVARLKANGHDTRAAEKELELFENALLICEQHLAAVQARSRSWD